MNKDHAHRASNARDHVHIPPGDDKCVPHKICPRPSILCWVRLCWLVPFSLAYSALRSFISFHINDVLDFPKCRLPSGVCYYPCIIAFYSDCHNYLARALTHVAVANPLVSYR